MSALEQMIPEGYKQTEVGVIPSDWEVSTISEKHTLATGCTPPTSNPKNYGGDYLFVSPVDLGGHKYIFITEKSLSNEGTKLARKYPKGSTLFTCIGSTIGKTGLATKELSSNQQINAVFPNGECDDEFTYYALTYIAPKVKLLAGQQAVPLINKTEFGETLYCLPRSLKEQTVIAKALSDVDSLLTELEKLITKKQAIKTATMQQLLTGKTRLPQFARYTEGGKQGQFKGMKDSELGEIPEDWGFYRLNQLITSTQLGGNYSNSETESNFPLIKMGNLGRGKIKLDKLEYASEAVSDRDRLKFDDVLFNTRNTLELVGKVAIWKDELPEAYFNSNIMRFVFDTNLVSSNSYMTAAMNTKGFVTELAGIATGTTSVAAIYTRDLLQLKLLIPSKQEQTAIAKILTDMDEEIQALEQRLAKTRHIKQGMMQELLTGRTRLPFNQES